MRKYLGSLIQKKRVPLYPAELLNIVIEIPVITTTKKLGKCYATQYHPICLKGLTEDPRTSKPPVAPLIVMIVPAWSCSVEVKNLHLLPSGPQSINIGILRKRWTTVETPWSRKQKTLYSIYPGFLIRPCKVGIYLLNPITSDCSYTSIQRDLIWKSVCALKAVNVLAELICTMKIFYRLWENDMT